MPPVNPASMQPQAPYGPPPAYGAPPYWAPPRPRPQGLIVGVVILVVFLVVMLVMFAFLFGLGLPVESFAVFLGPLCILVFLFIAIAIAAVSGANRRTSLPPPPPIQQPMVPAGIQGPVALTCPNCGAPPVNVDRFGVATCTYCGTRFLVR